ncbi:MAG: hypothetical protein NT090_05175 [Acidobacteria bacterium]|nr:hypothetical protein [Acidobacteriota bacterium]
MPKPWSTTSGWSPRPRSSAPRGDRRARFSGLGFRTFAGAYYDGDTLDNPRGWLEALDQTPNAAGIMYTTWQSKYALLADFGDLVSKR